MGELCRNANQTIVVLDPGLKSFIWVNENGIEGEIGGCIDKMLCKMEKRKCRIIGAAKLGEKLDNGPYTGHLGYLQRGDADLFLKPVSQYLDEPWLQRTNPVYTEK